MTTPPLLFARNIGYAVDGDRILSGVDLTVAPGERVAVVGPSGSGKTSLLAILAGLAPPTEGEVLLAGTALRGLPGPTLGVAMVLQGYGLVSLLTAAENVQIALQAAGRPPRQAREEALAMLSQLGLAAHADQLVEELSGGQQQRTAVARALALQPRLLIADEPTAEQDPAARALVMARMLEITDQGAALVLATHDLEVAERCHRSVDLRLPSVHSG